MALQTKHAKRISQRHILMLLATCIFIFFFFFSSRFATSTVRTNLLFSRISFACALSFLFFLLPVSVAFNKMYGYATDKILFAVVADALHLFKLAKQQAKIKLKKKKNQRELHRKERRHMHRNAIVFRYVPLLLADWHSRHRFAMQFRCRFIVNARNMGALCVESSRQVGTMKSECLLLRLYRRHAAISIHSLYARSRAEKK